jgi:hypothetical protein
LKKKGYFGFKSIESFIEIDLEKGDFETIRKRYTNMLTYLKVADVRVKSEASIKNIIEKIIEKGNKQFSLDSINVCFNYLLNHII